MFEKLGSKFTNYFNELQSFNKKIENLSLSNSGISNFFGNSFIANGSKYQGGLSNVQTPKFNRQALVNRSRRARFDSDLYSSLIYWLEKYTIGTGLSLSVAPMWDLIGIENENKKKKYKKKLESYFKLILDSKSLDFYGEKVGNLLLRDIFKHFLIDGDIFILFSYHYEEEICPLKLRIIPSENVKNGSSSKNLKNVFDGVELSSDGSIVAYHVVVPSNKNTNSTLSNMLADTVRMPVKTSDNQMQILHIKNAFNINDLRGVPFATHLFQQIDNIATATTSELDAMKLNASTLGIVERTIAGGAKGSLTAAETIFSNDDNRPKGNIEPLLNMFNTPGNIFNGLEAGESIEELSTSRPNLSLPAFVDLIGKAMTASMGVPMEVLYGMYNSNYSASRAAIQQFWVAIKNYRDLITSYLYEPIYETIITEFVKAGVFSLSGFDNPILKLAWLHHNWVGSSQPSLDPNKDITAAANAIEAGLLTRSRAAKELNGSDFEENIEALASEKKLMENANLLKKEEKDVKL